MHYIIVIVIIVIIVIFQIRFITDTLRKTDNFLNTFPANSGAYQLSKDVLMRKIAWGKDEELIEMLKDAGIKHKTYYLIPAVGEDKVPVFDRKRAEKELRAFWSTATNGISTIHENETLRIIVDSINNYLHNNKSVSDFHLMKDIVDRNCDAKEEEIATQIPTPLYMGLVGTMGGILVGILYLWLSGGIGDLLNANGSSGADGVEALLGGVALAMIASIIGIIFTTWGSYRFKTTKSTIEIHKHTFLSWIQAKLLPTLSDNIVGAIREMTGNLTEFNETFSSNIGNLDGALGKVNESYIMQTDLLKSVKQIADKDISTQNIRLLNVLTNSAKEISTLAEYLHNTNEYLTNVRDLNAKLDTHEERTRIIEEVGVFFKKEAKDIELRKAVVSKAVGTVDDYLKQSLDRLKENADSHFNEWQKATVKQQEVLKQGLEVIDEYMKQTSNKLKEHIDAQFDEWQKATVKQQELSQLRPVEMETVVSELRNMTRMLGVISDYQKTSETQNRKIDKLVDAMMLAKAKPSMSGAMKILLIIGGSIVSIACLCYVVPLFIQWVENL